MEKEKGVVIDEINSYKDSPSEDIYDRFEEMLFPGAPSIPSDIGNCGFGPENYRRGTAQVHQREIHTGEYVLFRCGGHSGGAHARSCRTSLR